MSSVAFDTLKLAQRLEAAGFPTKQTQETAKANVGEFERAQATQLPLKAMRRSRADLKPDTRNGIVSAFALQVFRRRRAAVEATRPLIPSADRVAPGRHREAWDFVLVIAVTADIARLTH